MRFTLFTCSIVTADMQSAGRGRGRGVLSKRPDAGGNGGKCCYLRAYPPWWPPVRWASAEEIAGNLPRRKELGKRTFDYRIVPAHKLALPGRAENFHVIPVLSRAE